MHVISRLFLQLVLAGCPRNLVNGKQSCFATHWLYPILRWYHGNVRVPRLCEPPTRRRFKFDQYCANGLKSPTRWYPWRNALIIVFQILDDIYWPMNLLPPKKKVTYCHKLPQQKNHLPYIESPTTNSLPWFFHLPGPVMASCQR